VRTLKFNASYHTLHATVIEPLCQFCYLLPAGAVAPRAASLSECTAVLVFIVGGISPGEVREVGPCWKSMNGVICIWSAPGFKNRLCRREKRTCICH